MPYNYRQGQQTNQQNAGNGNFQASQGDAQYNQQLGNWQQKQASLTAPQAGVGQMGQQSPADNGGGVDPFAASGGGVFQDGGWMPKSNAAARPQAQQGSQQVGQGGYGAQPYGYVAQGQPQNPQPMPQYQQYNYHPESVGGQRGTPAFGPNNLYQYSAESNQQGGYDQGAWNALSPEDQAKYRQGGGAPGAQPAMPSQGNGVSSNLQQLLASLSGGQDLRAREGAYNLANQAAGQAAPDTAGLKEQQKETLLALQKQQQEGMDQNAIQRGVGSGGNLDLQHMMLGDQFNNALTGAYRDIDQNAQQQTFDNLLKASDSMRGLAGQDISQRLGAAGQLQGTDMQNAQFGFQQQQAGADENARANQFNLATAGLGQQGDQFSQNHALQQQQAALSEYIQRQAAQQNQQQIGNQFTLGQGSQDLQRYLGDQGNAFNYAQLGQQGSQFDRNLAQQGGQFQQQFDYNGQRAATSDTNGFLTQILGILNGNKG
jgi:hypothetical protein